ncbi:MAG: hypothetical protein U5L00_01060 [Desulfovermiculus sp.]|nr:hypothetical protein [Desulfovermiculus sp.]
MDFSHGRRCRPYHAIGVTERLLRRGVLWRKRSLGTESETGDRWVERILSLTQTCRLQNKLSYPVLVEAIEHLFS